MKVFTNKNLLQKIVIVLIIILLFEYAVPTNVSNAADWGGALFKPIQALTLAIGDVGVTGLNLFIFNQKVGILTLSKDEGFFKIFNFLLDATVTITLGIPGLLVKKGTELVVAHFTEDDFEDEIDLPIMLVTPDQIFSNQVPLLDANVINPNKYKNDDGEVIETPVSILKSTIASWYIILRNICIVAFLSILVYVGIRILISSASENKAKYKQMLFDWIVGLCLLFFMHYIMSFAITITEKLTEFVDINNKPIQIQSDDVDLKDYHADKKEIKPFVDKFNEGGTKLNWKTDMMGYIRFYAQTNIVSQSVSMQFAYTLMYIILVIYTYMFVFQYIKRLLSIIFLTLISPFIALMYPIEKINGNAQAFNTWLKEYIYNLLLQPMHLILYTVFVGSAISLSVKYPIYAVIVLGFLLESEKLVRKIFGFDKESLTGSASSGFFTGAMVMKGVDAVLNKGKKAAGISKENNKKVDGADNSRVRLAENRTSSNSSDDEDNFMRSALGLGSGNNNDNNNNNNDNNDGNNNNDNNDDLSNYDTPIMPNDESLDNNQDYDTPPIVPNGNYLHMMHPDQYDEYGNYIERDGTRYDSNENVGDSSNSRDNVESIVPNGNYLHMMHPDQYDEYGNAIVRNGEQFRKQKKKKERKKIKSRPARFFSAAGQKVRSAAKSKPARYTKAAVRFYAPKVLKTTAKAAAKAATIGVVGGTAGMIGLAAGLATDKPTNAITYTMGAVTGGVAAGNAMVNRAVKMPSNINTKVKEARENMAREAYKDDPKAYKKYLNEQADKEFMKNKEIKAQYQKAFGSDNAKQMMRNAIKYREHGITDNELIIKTMKESSGEIGKTSVIDNRRIAAAKLASGVNNGKDIESMTKRLKKQGYKDEVIDQNEEFIRNIRGLKYN